MYRIREIILKNGSVERKDLVIQFDDPKMDIVGEFLMADARLLQAAILDDIDRVLAGGKDFIASSGNRCKLEINAVTTWMYDLFEDLDDVNTFSPYEIDTRELRRLVIMWLDKLEVFKKENE